MYLPPFLTFLLAVNGVNKHSFQPLSPSPQSHEPNIDQSDDDNEVEAIVWRTWELKWSSGYNAFLHVLLIQHDIMSGVHNVWFSQVKLDWIHGHFSRLNINSNHMVSVPLNRVIFSLFNTHFILADFLGLIQSLDYEVIHLLIIIRHALWAISRYTMDN